MKKNLNDTLYGKDAFNMPVEIEPERYELHAAPRYHFELDRRDFIKTLGGGVVVILTLRDVVLAQESGAGRQGGGANSNPTDLGAWVHIAEDGTVNVFSGKTEVGQNIRTSLSQVAAEELHVPISQVRMVMADTDLTPYDLGTFGSLTVPRHAPLIRQAAAATRELLLEMAATQLGADKADIVIDAGKIRNRKTNQSLSFGQLTKGQKLVKVIATDLQTVPADKWQVSGQPLTKVNGRDIVTGKHKYAPDLKRPGMLYGKVLRPASFNASIASIDPKNAQAISGVTFVRDGDFAGVTAPSELAATKALEEIRVQWSSQRHVPENDLFEYLRIIPTGAREARPQERGSIEKGLAEADHKVDETYTVAYIAHAPLEPRTAVAEWNGGRLTVWTGTQRPFGVRSELAEAFKIPESQIRVIVPDTGSGYGGKHTGDAAVEAARLAKAAGKPVKLVWTREEEFTWAYFRPAGVIDVKSAMKQDGTITAWEFHNYNSGNAAIGTMYDIPNQRIAFHATDSPLRQGSYRGLAATANHFARESHMDAMAAKLGMDPLEFRYKNLKDARLRAVYDAAAERFGWGKDKSSPNRGYGLAGGFDKGGYIAMFADVAIDSAKKVRIQRVVAAFECGAVLNPDQLKNQIQGSIMMGVGGALFEAIHFEAGKILNPRFSKYRVPRFSDMPEIDVVLLDRKDLPSAGAGETPIVGLAPAVGNAIAAATGVRMKSLPMAPNGLQI